MRFSRKIKNINASRAIMWNALYAMVRLWVTLDINAQKRLNSRVNDAHISRCPRLAFLHRRKAESEKKKDLERT